MHHEDPISDLIPPEYQQRQREEQAAKRREVALAAAYSAGQHDARGLIEHAEEDWRDVEDTVGVPVPDEYREERRRGAAERAGLP